MEQKPIYDIFIVMEWDLHLIILIAVMLVTGMFGGYLNYLNDFDTLEKEEKTGKIRMKYILLGIGAAFLIPLFLKMIESNIISGQDNLDYLIFAGFCLVAAIFSRRFISSIGDKILEAAKNAQKVALESKINTENTQKALISAKERIEDVRLAVDIKTSESKKLNVSGAQTLERLKVLADSFVGRTSVPDYGQRIGLKAALGRKMGEIIIMNRLSKKEILQEPISEGLCVALAYAVQLGPESGDVSLLNQAAAHAKQLFTKHAILIAYDTLAGNNLIFQQEIGEVFRRLEEFKKGADHPLQLKIAETENILSLLE